MVKTHSRVATTPPWRPLPLLAPPLTELAGAGSPKVWETARTAPPPLTMLVRPSGAKALPPTRVTRDTVSTSASALGSDTCTQFTRHLRCQRVAHCRPLLLQVTLTQTLQSPNQWQPNRVVRPWTPQAHDPP